MKPVSFAVVCAAFLSASTFQAPRALAQNVSSFAVPNAGFENGETPVGWNFSSDEGGAGKWRWESGNVAAGGRAIHLSKSNDGGYIMLASDFIPLPAGKNYEAVARVRAGKRSNANVYFMVSQYKDAQNTEMQFPNAFGLTRPLFDVGNFETMRATFTVRPENSGVRLHVIIAGAPAEVTLDDVQIREVGSGEVYKPRFEMPVAEKLPSLEPALAKLKARKSAVAVRKVVNGRGRLFVDGKATTPTFYVLPFVNYTDAQIADFKKAGVRIYLIPLTLGRGVYGKFGPWLGKNQYDWKEVEERLLRVLRVDPDGYVMFYMATDPYLDWAAEHPAARVKDQNGQEVIVDMHVKDWGRAPVRTESGYQERYGHSYVSADLRSETAETLRHLSAYLKTIDAGKAVIGFHIAGGADGQFFQWAGYKKGEENPHLSNYHLADYSDDSRDEFRRWLKRKYGTASTLQRAWSKPDATFETVEIPSGARRLAGGFSFDAKNDRDIADYNRFYSEGTAETIQGYARVLRSAMGKPILCSTYWEDAASNIDSHLATGKLTSTQDLDFLAGPTDYGVRMPGETGESHSVWGSLLLSGKFWVSEQDFRSWLTGYSTPDADYSVGRPETAAQHNAMVRRESGMMLAFGQGTWWYDMVNSWFRDDGIMKGIAEAQRAFKRDLSTQGMPRADVAVFVSERGLDFIKMADEKGDPQSFRYNIQQQIRALNSSGVPYHLFLQSDLPKLKQSYKLYLFLNPQHFENAEWNALQKLKTNRRVLAFLHSPGIASRDLLKASSDAAAISKVTGIAVSPIATEQRFALNISPNKLFNLPAGEAFARGGLVGPTWKVTDKAAQLFGVYSDGASGAAARDFKTWRSVFIGGNLLTDRFVNALAKYSGAWVAAPAGDAVYANQNILTIHAVWNGDKTLQLLQPSRVTDLTTGQLISPRALTFKLKMKRGETRWFALSAPTR